MTFQTSVAVPQRSSSRRAFAAPALPAIALLLLFAALRPLGYHGGGWDDWHYLEAARCAARDGLCVPTSHWWTRWPLVAPMGASLRLLGESREILWIVPAAYALAATLLFSIVVQQQFGRKAALVAALALVSAPIFNERILNPNVDIPELTWVLAAVAAVQRALVARHIGWAAVAGLLLAIAVISRPTSVTLVPIALASLAISPAGRRLVIPFAAAFALALAAEAGGYWLWTGDPLLGWRLALSHTTIPSSELSTAVDLGQSPLFNIAYIDGWAPASGIELHWTIDALLNLLVHPSVGPVLLLALLLLIVGQRFPRRRDRRIAFVLLGAAALHFGALVYALAIDPKPRMFLFETAIAAALIGVCGTAVSRRGFTILLPGALALLAAISIAARHDAPAIGQLEPVAASWVQQQPGTVVTNEFTRRMLTLVPTVNKLDTETQRGDAGALILVAANACPAVAHAQTPGRWRLSRQFVGARADSAAVAWLRANNLLFGVREAPALCLFTRV